MSRIPNNIHIVYGLAKDFGWKPYKNSDNIPRPGADSFNLIRYLSVKSAYEINKPDNFYFYFLIVVFIVLYFNFVYLILQYHNVHQFYKVI